MTDDASTVSERARGIDAAERVATGMLHATGIGMGLVHRWPAGRRALRAAGAAVALAGMAFLWRAVSGGGV